MDFETLRTIGLSLPGVVEGTAYGQFALKIAGKLLACRPANKSAEPDSLAVRMDFDQRAEVLRERPQAYYVPSHYESSPVVLVRMSQIDEEELRDLLKGARVFVTKRRK